MIPKIRKILYATDLTPNSAYAFRYAIDAAKKHNASIVILHVLEPIPGSAYAPWINIYFDKEQEKKNLEELLADKTNQIKRRLEIFCDRELKGDPERVDRVVSIELCQGFPAEVILRKANELECDAIVMGTHGKGIIGHTFLGSTAKRVLRRVRKPVFIIPLPKGETDVTFHDA